MKRLAIVVPCYNEEEVLKETNKHLLELLNKLISLNKVSKDSFIMYVNDGSKDKTWEIINELYNTSNNVHGLNLAGNKGHQNALFAGLMQAKEEVDVTISIDADMQDDINAIELMIDKYNLGNDIVYGVRDNRESDSFFKRFTAQTFYKVMSVLGAKSIYNHADFRLMSKRSLDELSLYSEAHLYLRGIALDLGFKTDCVYYARSPRFAGESKYPLRKMISFALNGITSFSIKPLTLILNMGILVIIASILFVIYSLIQHFNGHTISGWTSTFASIWFLGGVQLASIGVIGTYLGKNFVETKKRPRYFIESYIKH